MRLGRGDARAACIFATLPRATRRESRYCATVAEVSDIKGKYMKQKSICRSASLAGIGFAFVAASSATLLAETSDEVLGKYNQAMMCGTYMGHFTILAQRINDKKMEAAFEAATERYMRETVSLGAKLGKSDDAAIAEFKKTAEFYANAHSDYSEREIETLTTSCAPGILPLLK